MSTKIDHYGFDEKTQYNRSKGFPIKKIDAKSIGKWIGIISLTIFILIIIGMFSFSGYIAWNSFTKDPVWLKLSKTYLAILFSPVFLFYIFLRSIVFKLPN